MQALQTGRCGLCGHSGEHSKTAVLVTMLSSRKADAGWLDACGHPKRASLPLKVSPISGCDGFVPADAA